MDPYKITINTWNKIARIYQEKFMDLELYNESYDFFCDELPNVEPSILEIACGPGNITRYLTRKIPRARILATDVAANMILLARENCPSVDFQLLDCREINQLTQKFDGVVCGFCMPYLSKKDIKQLIDHVYTLLNENGVFYFSTIEGNYEDSRYQSGSTGDSTFVYYYSETFIQEILQQQEFKIIKRIKKQYQRKEGSETHLIYLVKK